MIKPAFLSRTFLAIFVLSFFAGCGRKKSSFKLPLVFEAYSSAKSQNSHVDIWGRALKTQEVEEIFGQSEVNAVSEAERPAPEKIVPWVFAIANKTDTTVDVELSALENEIVSASQIKKSIMNPYQPWNKSQISMFGASLLGAFVLPLSVGLTAATLGLIWPSMSVSVAPWVIIGNQLVWTTAFPLISSRNSYKAEFDYHMQFTQFLDSAIFPNHYALAPREEIRRVIFTYEKSSLPLTFLTTGADGVVEPCIVQLPFAVDNNAFLARS
jgi:hypothetical protein